MLGIKEIAMNVVEGMLTLIVILIMFAPFAIVLFDGSKKQSSKNMKYTTANKVAFGRKISTVVKTKKNGVVDTMELQELNEAIDKWVIEKSKDKGETDDHLLLLIADVGQLAQAIWEEDFLEQQEAIGILYISLRIIMIQQGGMFEDTERYSYTILGNKPIRKTYMLENLCRQLGDVFDGDGFNEALQHVAQYLELDFIACVQTGYDTMKDANVVPLDYEMLCYNKY